MKVSTGGSTVVALLGAMMLGANLYSCGAKPKPEACPTGFLCDGTDVSLGTGVFRADETPPPIHLISEPHLTVMARWSAPQPHTIVVIDTSLRVVTEDGREYRLANKPCTEATK